MWSRELGFVCHECAQSDRTRNDPLSLSIVPEEMAYYHNPVDSLVAFGMIPVAPGLDFGEKRDVVANVSGLRP